MLMPIATKDSIKLKALRRRADGVYLDSRVSSAEFITLKEVQPLCQLPIYLPEEY